MKILLALSGGIDSMYLANRASDPDGPFASYPGPHEFAAAHCNFSLRGDESDGDEAFVRAWCKTRGIECFVRKFDTLAYAEERGISTEMAARDLRYGWFAELIQEHGFDALAVAHNANDNAETLFLNLLRGTGVRGLRGMTAGHSGVEAVSCSAKRREKAPQDAPLPRKEREFAVLRPLLKTERKEIEKWMRANGKEWREDRTNAESVYKRNILRNDVFPILAKINPSFVRTIGEDMERFTVVDEIAEDYYQDNVGRVVVNGEIMVDSLLELRHWEFILWRILEESGISYPTFGKMVALLERYRTEPRGTVTICGKSFETPSALISIDRIPSKGPAISLGER